MDNVRIVSDIPVHSGQSKKYHIGWGNVEDRVYTLPLSKKFVIGDTHFFPVRSMNATTPNISISKEEEHL